MSVGFNSQGEAAVTFAAFEDVYMICKRCTAWKRQRKKNERGHSSSSSSSSSSGSSSNVNKGYCKTGISSPQTWPVNHADGSAVIIRRIPSQFEGENSEFVLFFSLSHKPYMGTQPRTFNSGLKGPTFVLATTTNGPGVHPCWVISNVTDLIVMAGSIFLLFFLLILHL